MAHGITDMIREATGGSRTGKEGLVTEFANAIGTTPTTVTRWRDGVIPGPRWRPALARYFKTTEDEIDLASQIVGVGLEDIDRKLDVILLELREHRRLIELDGVGGSGAAVEKLTAAVQALSRRLDRRPRGERTPTA